PFDSNQGEERKENDDNNQLTKTSGGSNLDGRLVHRLSHFQTGQTPPDGFGAIADTSNAVIQNDDDPIDDNSEVKRPQAHEVSGDASMFHDNESDQKRQGDR